MKFWRPSFRFSRLGLIVTLAFILANVVALVWIYAAKMPSYPIGWDAPYYITNIRYLENQVTIGPRMGFIGVVALVHQLTNISLNTLMVWVTPMLVVILAFGIAGLVYQVADRNLFALAMGFFFSLWFTSYFALSVSTFDNAFGLALTFLTLNIALILKRGWIRGGLFFFGTLLIGITHLESFGVLSLIIILYWLLFAIQQRTWVAFKYQNSDILLSWGAALLGTGWIWWGSLRKITSGYLGKADPGGNASIPFANIHNLTEAGKYFSTSISGSLAILIVITAVIFLLVKLFRRQRKEHCMALAYILSTYAVLMYAVLRKSIPINRATLLVPVPMLLGLGTYYLYKLLRLRMRLFVSILFFVLVILTFKLPLEYIDYMSRFPRAIGSNFYSFQELSDYVAKNNINSFVVVAHTDSKAASAYYGLWRNWISATAPLPTSQRAHCLYLGSFENLIKNQPTYWKDNYEYYTTSLVGLECIKSLPEPPKYFVIYGSYGDTKASLEKFLQGHKTTRLSEYVYEVLPGNT